MPNTTTLDRLCAIVMKDYKLDAAQLTPDAPLDALGIDSLGVADLLFNMEDEFGISLPPEPVQLLSLGDVARFIDDLLAKQQRQADAPSAASPAALPAAMSSTVP